MHAAVPAHSELRRMFRSRRLKRTPLCLLRSSRSQFTSAPWEVLENVRRTDLHAPVRVPPPPPKRKSKLHVPLPLLPSGFSSAEQSIFRTQGPPPVFLEKQLHRDCLGLAKPIDLLRFKLELSKLCNRDVERAGISLSVTDCTAMDWCELQTAYQTATGKRKVATAAVTKGSGIHQALEDASAGFTVQMPVTSKEEELAVSLLNIISAVRQLHVEGATRELRMSACIKGQWLVGVVDSLRVDPETGLVSMTETKTRRQASKPSEDQVRTARLQVMAYHSMYESYKAVSVEDLTHYLFKVSSSWVGLRPEALLSTKLSAVCIAAGILPSKPLSPSATAASEQRGRDVLHDLVHNRPGQAVPTSGLQAQQLQQWLLRFTQQGRGVDQQVVGEGQRDHSMDARHGSTKQQGCGESQQLDVSDQQACGGSERVENSYQQGMHCQQLGYGTGQNGQIETSQQRKRTKRRKSKEGAAVSQQQGHVLDQPQPLNDQQHVVAQPELQQGQELEQHSQGKGARRIVGQQQEQQGGGTPKHQQQQQQQQQQAKQQHPQGEGASQQCQQEHQQQHQRQRHQQQHQNQQQQQQHNLTASSTGPHQQQQKSVRLHQQQQQQQQRQQQQHLMANSTDPQQQQQKLMRLQLQDVVQALHKSLTLLPPLGNMHGLDFLDRHGALIAREEVLFDAGWLHPRMNAALDVWTGQAAPRPVDAMGLWKCDHCTFRTSCKLYDPQHPLSEPAALAARTLDDAKKAKTS